MHSTPESPSLRPLMRSAMAMSAVVIGYHVAARATRDTLFLSNFHVRSLPLMVAAASALSIGAAFAATSWTARIGPARFLRWAFWASALLTLGEWALVVRNPGWGAVAVYAHVAALGPVLISGFWSMLNERLDPRSAKKAVGTIAGLGTLGGLVGGVLVERLTAWQGVAMTFPALALSHAWCAWATGRLPGPGPRAASPHRPRETRPALSVREGARRIVATPYLQNLALLVFGSSVSAGLLDYVFKAQASSAAAGGLDLMRVFAAFYAAVSILTFVVQTGFSRLALERAGLARTIGTLPAAVVVGGAAATLVPNPWTAGVVRGVEAVLRGSLFRAGNELLYTPIPAQEKRATRILLDVACDRVGEIVGAAIIMIVLWALPSASSTALLFLTVPCAGVLLFVVARVQRGYVASLEAGLRAGKVDLDPTQFMDLTTMSTLQRTLRIGPAGRATPVGRAASLGGAAPARATAFAFEGVDPSRSSSVARVEQLVVTLLDPQSDFDVRRRIPGVLAKEPSARAVDGLMRGLDDARFEVRYRCGRALAHLLEGNDALSVEGERVFAAVRHEATLAQRVWELQRLLDRLDEPSDDAFVDEFLRDRAGRSLEHVFTLLSLVLPREPLRIAFRGLHADDRILRGTALEYLDTVLPPDVRNALWPHLEPEAAPRRARIGPPRDREQVLDDLMRSNRSIELNLEALRGRKRDLGGA